MKIIIETISESKPSHFLSQEDTERNFLGNINNCKGYQEIRYILMIGNLNLSGRIKITDPPGSYEQIGEIILKKIQDNINQTA